VRITGLIWLADIVEKLLEKHGVRQQEVQEVFASRPYFRFVEKGHRRGENVYVALGQTESGRYLAVFFVWKKSGHALILSARDMTRAERRLYEQR